MESQSTSVLVVGGGLVGLSAAMFLAWRGVPTLLVERHPGSSAHPRALGFMTRTTELYRAVGLGSQLPPVPRGMGRPRRIAVESLAGKWGEEAVWTPPQPSKVYAGPPVAIEYSPCTGAGLAQDRLEPMLRERAIALGADVRLSTEMTSFSQDGAAVTASLRRKDGTQYTLRADYLVAADGNASPVREALGIGRSGLGHIGTVRSVLFRAQLDEYLQAGISQFDIDQPGLKARLVTYRDGRWALMFEDDVERDEQTFKALIVKAIGRSDLDVEILATGRWTLSALIADRFSAGRVFIAGDAAHTFPPARGGYGANTGIEDVHNLAWKLAAVLAGESKASLLETYDAERRPIAWLRHGQIFNRPDYASVARSSDKKVPLIDDDAMELGQLYRSEAVLGADADLPSALPPEQWAGQPGTRAPHRWVSKQGERVSTLDLLQRHWVLLTANAQWCVAAAKASEQLQIKVECVQFGGTASRSAIAITITAPPLADGTLTIDSPIERIVASPAGKAALDAKFPGLTSHASYDRFKAMNLVQLQPMSQGVITDEGLAAVAAALVGVVSSAPLTDSETPEMFEQSMRALFGIGANGATLIRPDGYVAWRAVDMPADPAAALTTALRQIASAVR